MQLVKLKLAHANYNGMLLGDLSLSIDFYTFTDTRLLCSPWQQKRDWWRHLVAVSFTKVHLNTVSAVRMQSQRLRIGKLLRLPECSRWKRIMKVLWVNHYYSANASLQNILYCRVSRHCWNTLLLCWQRCDSMLWECTAGWLAVQRGWHNVMPSDMRRTGGLAHAHKETEN